MNSKKFKDVFVVAIIGCGPRGLSALESLYQKAAQKGSTLSVIVFEETDQPGAGPVYDNEQPDTNWLNVAERAVDIWPRKKINFKGFSIPQFPTFQEWVGYDSSKKTESEVDFFPPRSKMGTYLRERYESIAHVLEGQELLTMVHGKVVSAKTQDGSISLEVLGGALYEVDEAVLAIGHQPIELDEQLISWQSKSLQMDGPVLFTDPYPVERILASDTVTSERNIGIRGFGLAMIDVTRALSIGMGGDFELSDQQTRHMHYVPSGNEPKAIVPFSLDGLPMAPKPLNLKIDRHYVPSDKELECYSGKIKKLLNTETLPTSAGFLIEGISPLIATIYSSSKINVPNHRYSTNEIKMIVEAWLKDENFEHELILSLNLTASEMMTQFSSMATGHGEVSLDYCIGHVWRHCQPTMYKLLSFKSLDDKVIAKIVALDERLKRYSYGPPVDSLQQLLALERAGILNLSLLINPEIKLTESGWIFAKDINSISVETMVNSVLDAPQILKVAEPLPKGLIKGATVEALHDKLGIRTRQDAIVEFDKKDVNYPLAVLGRLAKGTLIGVDAIAECFGIRSEIWAVGVIERLSMSAKKSK